MPKETPKERLESHCTRSDYTPEPDYYLAYALLQLIELAERIRQDINDANR